MPFTLASCMVDGSFPADALPDFRFDGRLTVGDIRSILATVPAAFDSQPFVVGYPYEDGVMAHTFHAVMLTELVDGEIMLIVDPSIPSPDTYFI